MLGLNGSISFGSPEIEENGNGLPDLFKLCNQIETEYEFLQHIIIIAISRIGLPLHLSR
jgi:hypothetical protein